MPVSGSGGKVLVLGVGNILLKDEGLGVRAVEYMLERYSPHAGVSFVDGGTAGLSLLSLIKEFDRIIIIDAVKPVSSPGKIYRIAAIDLPESHHLFNSAHGIGVREVLAAAKFEGAEPDAVIIGVEPDDISMGLDLSLAVEKTLPAVASMVVKELEGSVSR
jgi:hydrogenase maturation protease